MTIEIKRTAEVTTIDIVGRLDTTTAHDYNRCTE